MTYDVIWHTPLAIKPGRKAGFVKLYIPFAAYAKRIDAVLTAPKDWEFDLDSVPRIPIVYWLFKGRCGKRAAAVHDLLYERQLYGVSRLQCDLVMWDQMTQDAVPKRWRIPIFVGVRMFGWIAWRANKRKVNGRN